MFTFVDLQSPMLTRRAVLLAPAALLAGRAASAAPTMTLALHQNTSAGAGYRGSLEGWARAGIKYVELTNTLLDEFLKTDSLAAARRVLTDLGLTPVSSACGVFGLLGDLNPNRAAALDGFKKRCEDVRRARADPHLLANADHGEVHAGRLRTRCRKHA